VQPVPFVAAGFTSGKIGIGIGVFAPHGYGKRSYPDSVRTASGAVAPAPQRYDTVSQEGVIALPSAGLSYAVSDKVTVGARASYGFASVASRRFAQGLPNDAEDPAADTDATVQVEDRSVITWGAGLHIHASPTWEIGAAYSAPIRIDAVGTTATVLGDDLRNLTPGEETRIEPVPDNMAQCAPGGQVGAIMTCVDLMLPQTATVGVRWIARDGAGAEVGDIEVDLKWENWAAADQMNVQMDGVNSAVDTPVNPTRIRHGYQDVYSVRVGGSTRLGSQRTTVASFGVGYESAAAPASWTRLDVDTAERFTAGAGFSFAIGRARLDLGAAIIDPADRHVYDDPSGNTGDMSGRLQPDIPVPLSGPDEQPYNPFNAGRYTARYLIGSVGLAMAW
jgi:long-subunit fatty acid transport protein